MCGRYEIQNVGKLQARFDLGAPPLQVEAQPDITPGQIMPVVLQGNEQRQLELMKWGLIPAWAKDPKIGYRTINARAETVAHKPAFRRSFESRRCIVPASGFYEWQQTPAGKMRYRFSVEEEELFGFAGLYDIWCSPDGQMIRSYSVITTTANELVAPVHDRMPVILPRRDEAAWLDPATPTEHLATLLAPYSTARMQATAVPLQIHDFSFLQHSVCPGAVAMAE